MIDIMVLLLQVWAKFLFIIKIISNILMFNILMQ